MTLLAPRIGNDVSCATRINHEIHFAWHAQYMLKLSCDSCCSTHCNDVSYVMRINHEVPFAWQAQCLVKLDCDSCYSAHCI